MARQPSAASLVQALAVLTQAGGTLQSATAQITQSSTGVKVFTPGGAAVPAAPVLDERGLTALFDGQVAPWNVVHSVDRPSRFEVSLLAEAYESGVSVAGRDPKTGRVSYALLDNGADEDNRFALVRLGADVTVDEGAPLPNVSLGRMPQKELSALRTAVKEQYNANKEAYKIHIAAPAAE